MSFGVDTLGGLIEKLKQLVNETQDNYESFFDSTQLYKQGKMDSKEYFSKIGEYLVSSSALNFLACRVILELKNAIDKGVSMKSSIGDSFPSVSSSHPGGGAGNTTGSSGGNIGNTATGFGVDSFVSSGGRVGSTGKEYDLPMPQESPPSFKPVDIVIPKAESNKPQEKKNCIVCAATIPKHAKFCNKCGRSQ
jgi:ribosomal protein L40E